MSRNKLKPKVRKGYSQGFSLHFINVKFIILTLLLGNSYYVNIEYRLFTLGCMVYNNISQHSGADLQTISYLHRTECKLCARVLSCMNLSTEGIKNRLWVNELYTQWGWHTIPDDGSGMSASSKSCMSIATWLFRKPHLGNIKRIPSSPINVLWSTHSHNKLFQRIGTCTLNHQGQTTLTNTC